jgi:hypothetical protein
MSGPTSYTSMIDTPLAERVATLLMYGGYTRMEEITSKILYATISLVKRASDNLELTRHHRKIWKYPIYEHVKRFLEENSRIYI